MTWFAVGGAAVGVIGQLTSSDSNGGAGATTATKEPWSAAAPWLKSNIATGQSLQNQYAANPFNQQQLNSYGAQSNQTAYINQLIPSLLDQLGNQPTGFDRSNPTARPTAYNFNGMGRQGGQAAPSGASGGLLGMLSQGNSNSGTSAANPIPSAVAPPALTGDGSFLQTTQRDSRDPMPWLWGSERGSAGGYGAFKYGEAMPQAGTQAYRDMSSYFANGGTDPSNTYGHGTPAPQYYQNGDGGA